MCHINKTLAYNIMTNVKQIQMIRFPKPIRTQIIDGKIVDSTHCLILPVDIGGNIYNIDFTIFENLSYDFIIGMSFLNRHEEIFDLKSKKVTLETEPNMNLDVPGTINLTITEDLYLPMVGFVLFPTRSIGFLKT